MIYDQHVHSHFSSDSKTEMETYFIKAKELGLDKVFFTDHLDFEVPYLNGGDRIFDAKAAQLEIARLSKKYGVKGILGCEVGFRKDLEQRISAFISQNNFDYIILSVHHNHEYSISKIMKHLDYDSAIKLYFNILNDLVDSNFDYDVIGHIEFFFRYSGNQEKIFNYKNEYTKVLKKLIQKDKVLGINSGSIGYFKDTRFMEFILGIYKELGGSLVSVGSDSHMIEDYRRNFDIVIDLLKRYGFNKVTTFENRKRYFINI